MEYQATALLTNYKRPEKLVQIIQALRNQSVSVEIFLWNNGSALPKELTQQIDLVINSSRNLQCLPRWTMACYASSPYVFSLDDDLIPIDQRTIEKCIERVGEQNIALGYEGVTLIPEETYDRCVHVSCYAHAEGSVDIIKGRFLFARKAVIVKAIRGAIGLLEDTRIEDDIIISSFLPGRKILPSNLHQAFINFDVQHAISSRPEHYENRERTRRLYFNI